MCSLILRQFNSATWSKGFLIEQEGVCGFSRSRAACFSEVTIAKLIFVAFRRIAQFCSKKLAHRSATVK
ncbi:MAG: hypothetical protein DME65_02770 [Verrucomicrobia bacterium]|nr:MAG: hypothetical protein DME65_02770 [Verrucomicrobiota bacterium]